MLVPIFHTSGNVRTDICRMVRLKTSPWPLLAGWYGVLIVFVISTSQQKAWNKSYVKFLPWSVWTSRGHPNVIMKCLRNALAVSSAFCAGRAASSAHFVNWFTMTRMYDEPDLLRGFIGPSMSR